MSDSNDITIGWYFAVLHERWRCLVGGLVVGALLAGMYLAVVGSTATARSVVSVNVIATSPFDQGDAASNLIDSVTEVEYAKSYEVARLASESLGDVSAREIRDSTTVSSIVDATVLDISYVASTPDAARRGANAVAQAYLDYRSSVAQQRIDAGIADIDLRTSALRSELDELSVDQAAAPEGSAQAIQLEVDRSIALTALNSLLSQRFDLERIDTTSGTIISPAEENHVAFSPARKLVVGAGVFGGLLVGVVVAFVRNATDRRLRSVRQLTASLGARDLGRVSGGDATGADSLESDDLRAARAELALELPAGTTTLVAVDLTNPHQGVLGVIGLAASLSQIAEPALVVVVGASARGRDQLISNLGLSPPRVGQREPMYRVPASNRLRVFFADGEGGGLQIEAARERAVTARSRANDADSLFTWIVVAPEARDDLRTVAIGASSIVLVVATLGCTTRDAVISVGEHCQRSGSRVIGAVTTR